MAEEAAAEKASVPRRFSAEYARHAGVVAARLLEATHQSVEVLSRQHDTLGVQLLGRSPGLGLEGMIPRWVSCCRHELNLQRAPTIEVPSSA